MQNAVNVTGHIIIGLVLGYLSAHNSYALSFSCFIVLTFWSLAMIIAYRNS